MTRYCRLLAPLIGLSSSFSTLYPVGRVRAAFHRATAMAKSSVENHGDAAAYNNCASSAVDLSNAHLSDSGLLTLTRSVRDIDGQKRPNYLYTIPVEPSLQNLQISPHEIHDKIQLRLPSPSGKIVAIFRDGASKDAAKDGDAAAAAAAAPILEVWRQGGQTLERRIRLSREGYGKVVVDTSGGFGLPSWNAAETALVFGMEQKPEEAVSFFECDEKVKSAAIVGGQNELGVGKAEHWGEKYASKSPLCELFCVNVDTGKFDRVDNVPRGDDGSATAASSSSTSLGGYALGQAVFHPVDGQSLVYTGWDAGGGPDMPRRLGLVYCQQRPCQLYRSVVTNLLQKLAQDDATVVDKSKAGESSGNTTPDPPCTALTANFRMSHSPRFAPPQGDDSAKLVFLTSQKGFDTHSGCFALGVIDLTDGGDGGSVEPQVILDQVWDASSSPGPAQVAGLRFPGLYMSQLPVSCFVSPDVLVATTNWGSCLKTICISLTDGSVKLINVEGNDALSCDEVLYAGKGRVVMSSKTPGQPGVVHIVSSDKLLLDGSDSPITAASTIAFPSIASSARAPIQSSLPHNVSFSVRTSEAPKVDGVACDHLIQSILMMPPPSDSGSKPPLIVIPHGGPHSVSSTSFVPSYAFLCGHGGYALLLVNYRGSTGFGQASIEALPTSIGTLDVLDVISATDTVKGSGLVDADKVFVCGGSHGGFLVAHTTSQYPNYFSAAVMRNPVVNLASMVTTTDIPDWCHVECIGSYNWKEYRPPTLDELVSFYKKSPVQYIQQVQTPTLVALGLKDLRVPPSQGLEWYHTLRSMGVATKLLTYDMDDHAIDSPAAEADHWVNIKQWFDQYL